MASKDEKIVSIRGGAAPAFQFGADPDDIPEVNLGLPSMAKAKVASEVVQGKDLSAVPRILLVAGRGRTGKTTSLRWMTETALSSGRTVQMGDLDPTNASFSTYFEGVHRPGDADNPVTALRWLEQFISFSLQNKLNTVIDLGGGDTTLRRLVDELPELPGMVAEQGAALALMYFAGPQVDDLSPIAAMLDRGFQPEATAIVLNEALVEPGQTREQAFARVHKHSVFRASLARGAVPVWMPRLLVADAIEARRCGFLDAQDGKAGLGPFDRSRVRFWLNAMTVNFGGVRTWLP